MTVLLFTNNAHTTLGAGLSSGAVSMTLATGSGSNFPSPAAGQGFLLTLTQAAGGATPNEIVLCTARTGDTCTIVRAQENTTAQNWSLGDSVDNFCTAGTMANAVQVDQLQKGTYTASAGGGTATAITATVASNLTALVDRLTLVISAPAASTGAATLNVTLGVTATGAKALIKGYNAVSAANIPIAKGDIPAADYPMIVIWSATLNAWVLVNPASGTSYGSNASGNWWIRPDGLMEQSGITAALGTGSNTANITIAFPEVFGSGGTIVVEVIADNSPDGSHIGFGYNLSSTNTSSTTAQVATQDISITITNTVHLLWRAVGPAP